MIHHTEKPIVLTGSQKSIQNRDTDARKNLLRAFLYACSDFSWGIQIVFDNKVILGTRARKIRSRSYDAFASIDFPETAVFQDMRLVPFLPKPENRFSVQFFPCLDQEIFVLRLIPGLSAKIFDYLPEFCHGLIIEGFGMGGIPCTDNGKLIDALAQWAYMGKLTVFSTQVPHEGCDLSVYEVGRIAKALPTVIEARNMTPEAITTKLMWVLGQTNNFSEARELFLTPIQSDLF